MSFNKSNSFSVKRSKVIVISVILSVIIGAYFNANVLANPIKFIQNPVANNSNNSNEKGELILGKEVEQELSGEAAHSYSIKLEVSQYMNLVVEQKGVDIVATVFSPSGEKIYEVDSPNGTEGDEPIYLITQSSGTYRLEVRSLDKSAPLGKYQAKIVELRTSTPLDADRVAAFKILGEAVLLEGEGKNDLAITKYLDAIDKFEKISELVPKASASSRLAILYYNKGDYAKAEPFYIQALDIRKKILSDNHFDTIISINNLAFFYSNRAEYTKAEPLFIQALDTYRKISGGNNITIAIFTNNLAAFYLAVGDYSKAEPLLIQALEIRKKILGDNHPDTANTINILGSLYSIKGEYLKAEPLFIQALEISRKTFGDNHPTTANFINNLAFLHSNKGDYVKAEPLLIQALEIRKKILGDNHPDTVISLNNLAALYDNKGDYTKAELLYMQALEIRKKVLGDSHPDTALSLNNLGNLYLSKREYSKVEPLLIQALEIYKKKLGSNHTNTIVCINNLGNLYLRKGEYSKAEPLYIQALEIRKKALGDNHTDTAQSLNNLATFYLSKETYNKAEPLFIQALDIYRENFGDTHPNTIHLINNLANLYSSKRDYEKAVKYSQEASDAREIELSRNLTLGSERQKQLYLQLYANDTDIAISLHAQSAPTNVLAKELALTQILRRKGRSIDAVNQSVEALRTRSSLEDVLLLDELASKKAFFSNLTIQGLGKRSPDEYQKLLKSLQDEIEKLEYKISERSAEFRSQSQPITLEAIQKAIAEDSILVEFASYRTYNSKTREYGASRYVVYLLDKEGNIGWADLGEAELIDELVVELKSKLRNKTSSVAKEIKPLSRKLDKIIMEPVRKLAGKGKRLLIAPDSTLNLIPFSALVDENGKFLVENNKISYLTSGRDLLRLQIKINSKQPPVILADPDFGTTTEITSQVEGETIFAGLKFNRLEATELEAKAIKSLFPDSELLLQKQANEETLAKLNAPSILHIATHGFFLQEKAKPTPPNAEQERIALIEREQRGGAISIKVENPLLRSGIALAGANLRSLEKEQGIFTALKTTGLNLWGTKIVVLSACDTGVGEIKTGDGIYGLRRALVLAGSETQIMSLWPISDNGTKELMVDYYFRLKKGEGRCDALRQTQLLLLKSKVHNHPYYWASFIQSGEWANLDGKR